MPSIVPAIDWVGDPAVAQLTAVDHPIKSLFFLTDTRHRMTPGKLLDDGVADAIAILLLVGIAIVSVASGYTSGGVIQCSESC